MARVIKNVDFIKNVDLSALPFEIINDPTLRYRMGQIMGTMMDGVIGGILIFSPTSLCSQFPYWP